MISLAMPFWPETPIPPLAVGPPAQAGFLSSKPECLFLRNHDKLGPLPPPNGDSFKPLDSVELTLAELAPDSAFAADTLRTPTLGSFFSRGLKGLNGV